MEQVDITLGYFAKKYNLNFKDPSPITIARMSRGTLAQDFAGLGFRKGVEIGVQGGKFTSKLGLLNPEAKIYGIDPWLEYPDVGIPGKQEDQDSGYELAKSKVPANCTLIRKKSMDALDDFADSSLDFVYIDGNHIFSYVANDIFEWTKKVRSGGIISGHDYRRYYPRSFIHVFQVVNAYTHAYGIAPWFLTDNSTENVRSWFWVKP